jgi:capsular exopolysaccharide synthesis family protein
VVPAGPLPPNPPALLARPELTTALDQLRRHFRWILVDSPPVAAVTDALLLAHHADSTVLVVQQNRVDRSVVKRALNSLRKVTPRVTGAVLNAVDVKTKAYYGYAYYGGKRDERRKDERKKKEEAARRPLGTRAHRGTPKPAEVSDGSIS